MTGLAQSFTRGLLILAVVCALVPFGAQNTFGDDLINFEKMQGKWTGFGWFVFTKGNRDRARCTAFIRTNGSPTKGSLEFKCEAKGLKINAKAFNLELNGAKASGEWVVVNFSAKGTLAGTVTNTKLSVELTPTNSTFIGYTAHLSAEMLDECHVKLVETIASPLDLKKIDLDLRRC